MIYLEALDEVSESKRAEAIGQFDLFDLGTSSASSGSDAAKSKSIALAIPDGEWDKQLLLSYEREFLGLYVSDHPLLGVEHVLRAATSFTINQLSETVQDEIVTIAGLITQVQRKVSKQGMPWAIVTVEDLGGSVDILFFSNTYSNHGMNLVADRVVLIRGRVDRREELPRVTAIDLSLPDLKVMPTGPLIISMAASACTPPVIDRMKEILRSHPGSREVHLKLLNGEKNTILKLDEKLRVSSSPGLSADLKTVLGPDCLVS